MHSLPAHRAQCGGQFRMSDQHGITQDGVIAGVERPIRKVRVCNEYDAIAGATQCEPGTRERQRYRLRVVTKTKASRTHAQVAGRTTVGETFVEGMAEIKRVRHPL
jgi:hypothetical protein